MKIISLGFKFCNVMSQDLGVIKMISNSTVLANACALQLFTAASAGGRRVLSSPSSQLLLVWCLVT